ncbi:zf-HC2 domain-containing protein [bacterium]|nr:zf-HC2 domain-containing protein [bacterium]MBU1985352.1 zf-HC2 domain-containing protein [bacterium]
MNHLSEDKLLEYVLELLDGNDERDVRLHLEKCEECRHRYEKVQREVSMFGGVEATGTIPAFPLRRARSPVLHVALRAAALLLIGFLAGYGTSNWTCPTPVNVIPAYTELSPPADSLARFAVTDATGVSFN